MIALVIVPDGEACLDSNISWLRAVKMAHTTEEKISPDTPVGGRQVQCAEASRVEMKDEHVGYLSVSLQTFK